MRFKSRKNLSNENNWYLDFNFNDDFLHFPIRYLHDFCLLLLMDSPRAENTPRRVTLRMVSSLTRLDLTKNVVICMQWSSWIQTCKTADQPYRATSDSNECWYFRFLCLNKDLEKFTTTSSADFAPQTKFPQNRNKHDASFCKNLIF